MTSDNDETEQDKTEAPAPDAEEGTKSENLQEEQEAAKQELAEFESQDKLPSDLSEWPSGKAKFLTMGNESDEPYGEGPTGKLGPASLERHEDGSISVGGELVDNPEDYKGEPIPGGPTDPNSAALPGEETTEEKQKRRAEKEEQIQE